MPKSIFFDYCRPGDKTSFCLVGWSSSEGDAGDWYSSTFYTRSKKQGFGGMNRCHYSDPEFDNYVDKADSTANMAERAKYLQEATKIMEKDIPMIPLYFQEDAYGYSKTLEFTPRLDEWIYVYDIHFKK